MPLEGDILDGLEGPGGGSRGAQAPEEGCRGLLGTFMRGCWVCPVGQKGKPLVLDVFLFQNATGSR